jgi:preprotein translocase subunit SecB
MSEDQNNSGEAAGNAQDKQPQINVLGQYIKDFSFENPRAPQSLQGPGKNPNIQVNFNVGAQPIGNDAYEVALTFEATAKNEDGPLYSLEVVYAGGFRLRDLPQQAVRPVLFIECPALLFPFVRRLVSDLTREGGFPPLLIDPIDFASLYRKQAAQEQANAGKTLQ